MQETTTLLQKRTQNPNMTGVRDASVRSEVIIITPSVAAAWLDKNTCNRKRKLSVVKKYATDMANGRWRLTFDPIIFDADGVLLDGQHRLMACVESGCHFACLVVYNLPPETRDVIDTGASRTVGDVLTFRGVPSANHQANVARWIIAAKSGTGTPVSRSVSSQMVIDVLARHSRIIASVNKACFKSVCPSPGLLAFVHYAASVVIGVPETADSFVNVFKTGVPSRAGCPAHKLREFVVHSKNARTALKPTEYWRATVHTWNVFARGDEVKALRWPNVVTMDGLDLDKL